MPRSIPILLVLLATPLPGGAEGVAAPVVLAAHVPAGLPAPHLAEVRTDFAATMDAITRDLSDLVVTSTTRTEADQERLRRVGYRPARHSQHKLGLAWDCVGPAETLELVAQRARARGLVALPMLSRVTGHAYLHVQRYARSPLATAAAPPAIDGPGSAAPEPPPPAPIAIPPAPDAEAVVAAVEVPRPLAVAPLEFPRHLRRRKVSGEIVLLLELSDTGEVLDVEIDSSNLPEFEPFVLEAVRDWRFTPYTRGEQPIGVQARLPIPILIR